MSTTLKDAVKAAEEKKLSAERKVSEFGTDSKRFWDDLESQGVSASKMNDEQVTRGDYLNKQHRKAIDDLKRAEGALASLREVEADEAKLTKASLEVHEFAPAPEQAQKAATGPAWVNSDTGQLASITREQSVSDLPSVRDRMNRNAERDRHIVGEYGSLGHMVRALSTTGSTAVIPQAWANQVLDLARSKAQVLNAGATVVDMPYKQTNYGRLTTDPTAGFRAEGSALGVSDPAFDAVTLVAKTLSGQVVMSLEFVQDSINGEEVVTNALAEAIGLKLDFVALFGGLTTADCSGFEGFTTDANNPVGVQKSLMAQAAGQVLGSATNGTPITALTPFNELLDTAYACKNNNYAPNALLMNSKMNQKLAKTYDSTGQPLQLPKDLAAMEWLTTNQITSYTRGTATGTATNVFTGQWSELLIGQRMELELRVLNERYAELGQVSVVALWRGDVAVAHPLAFSVYRSLVGA